MKAYLLLLTGFFFSCSGSRMYYYENRHYLHLKLIVMKKRQEFRIINSRREFQPFGFSINGNWQRISDSALQLNADPTVYDNFILPDSLVVKVTGEFDWEMYKKYGNKYIFPFFRSDTLYELNSKRNVQLGRLLFNKKRLKLHVTK